jgi:AcrR family transcriptional regulator
LSLNKKAEEKKGSIAKAIVKIVAQQGYENATTRNIAKEAQVSHGTLHYYFKDKDEMVAFALKKNIEKLMEYNSSLEKGNNPQQLGENLVKFLKKNMEDETRLYYRFLFSIWSLSWQNKKIEKILKEMHEKVLDYLKIEIAQYFQNTNLKIPSEYNTFVSLYLMFLMDGTMLHLLLDEKYKDNVQLWKTIKNSINGILSSPFK